MDNTNICSVPPGLILKPKEEDHWELGSGLASQRFGGGDLNPSGDWTAWVAKNEYQSRKGFDTEACAVFHTLEAWITLANFYGFDDFPKDLSERYTGVFAGTTRTGTDPHIVAEVTRQTYGAVPSEVMPWSEDVETFEEYFNRQMALGLVPFGKKLLDRFELGHEWVFAFGSNYTPAEKSQRIRTALKRGVLCVSVDGNYDTNKLGKLTKPIGGRDTHWVTLLKESNFHDSYDPFMKELATDYDHNAAKVYFLKRKVETSRNFWDMILDNFVKLWIGKR